MAGLFLSFTPSNIASTCKTPRLHSLIQSLLKKILNFPFTQSQLHSASTYLVLPRVQVHNKILWLRVPVPHFALVAMLIYRLFVRGENRVWTFVPSLCRHGHLIAEKNTQRANEMFKILCEFKNSWQDLFFSQLPLI